MTLASISFAKQWAEVELKEPNTVSDQLLREAPATAAKILEIHAEAKAAAKLLMQILNAGQVSADKLVAIQRSFTPIDDDGTLPMMVGRDDVEILLSEVLRLRMREMDGFQTSGAKECPAQRVPAADENAALSEPESTEKTASVTSAVVNVPIVPQESKSPPPLKTDAVAIATTSGKAMAQTDKCGTLKQV